MKTQRLTAREVDKFFSKERPVFIRNVFKGQISMMLEREGRPLSFLIPRGDDWLRLDFPFEVIKNSVDLKRFLLKPNPPMQLWLGKKAPKGYKLQQATHSFDVVPIPELEEITMPPVDPNVVHPSPGREAFEIMTFNKVVEAFSEEHEALLTQIDFHHRSLEVAEARFNEVDPVYGVLMWLKENVFDEESKKQLIRNALFGKDEPGEGEKADYTLPRTYSALKEWVKVISSNGKYANLQERFKAYKAGARNGYNPKEESEASLGLHAKEAEAAPKAAHTLRSVPEMKAQALQDQEGAHLKRAFDLMNGESDPAVEQAEDDIQKANDISKSLVCDVCGFVAKSSKGLGPHKAKAHNVKKASRSKKKGR